MTKIRKHPFKIQPQSREITCQIFINFRLLPFNLKIRTKIGVCIMAKTLAIFQLCLLEMLGCIHSFMTGTINPKLSRGVEAIANGILHGFFTD